MGQAMGGGAEQQQQQFPIYLNQQQAGGWMGGLAGAGNVAGCGWANGGVQHSWAQ
jgi:hypothetical protein